jgi:hypothetical protein
MTIHPIKSDSRYTITQEHTGHISAKPQHVLRFCGEWIASSPFLSPMIMRAVGHKAQRDGAVTVIEKKA